MNVLEIAKAVVRSCLTKYVFLKIWQNSNKNSLCARVSFLIKLQVSTYSFIKKDTLKERKLSFQLSETF